MSGDVVGNKHKMMMSRYFDVLNEIVLFLDGQGVIKDINRFGLNLLGYSKEELVGQVWWDVCVPAQWRDEVAQVFQSASHDTENFENHENLVVTRTGEERLIRWHNVVIRDEQGVFVEGFATGEDITDHIKTTEKLSQTELDLKKDRDRLELAMDLAKLARWEYDFGSDEFILNDEYYALFGTTAREQGGYRMAAELFEERLVPVEDRNKISAEIHKAMETTDPNYTGQITHKLLRPDGKVRIIVSQYKVNRDEQGKALRAFGTTQDITESKEQQAELTETERKLRLAMEIAKLVSWEYDVASDRFTFNDQFYELYGTTSDKEGGYSMLSKDYAEKFVYPDDRNMVGVEIAKALATTDPHYSTQLNHRIVKTNGEIRTITVRFTVEKDEAGKTIKTYGANQDITDQVTAGESLNRQKSLLRNVINTIPDFVFWKDRESNYLGCNRNFARIAGLNNPEEIVGKNDFDLAWTNDEAKKYQIDDKAIMESGKERLNFEETQKIAGGRTTIITTSKVPLKDNDGQVVGVLGVYKDITEARLQQNKIAAAKKKFSALFENMKEGVAIHKVVRGDEGRIVNYRITEVNNAFATQTGLEAERVLGKLATEAYGVAEAPCLNEYGRALAAQKTESFETFFDPLKRQFMISAVPLSEDLFATVFMNVTEERNKSKKLEENGERLSVIYDNAPDAIYLYDLFGNFVDGNRASEELTGYKREELIGTSFLKQGLLTGRGLIQAAQDLAANVRGKATGPTEYVIHRKDDSITTAEVRNYPVTVGGKKLVLGVARNISDSIKAQMDLRKFKLGIEQSADAVFMVDLDNIISYVNPQFVQFYGYSADEIVGKKVHVLEAKPATELEVQQLMHSLQNRESIHRETHARKKSGEVVVVETSITPIIDNNNEVIGTLVIDRDITARRRAETELRKFKQGIERSNDVVFMTDTDGNFTYVNFAFIDLYGYDWEEIKSKTPRILKSGVQTLEFYNNFWETLLHGSVVSARLVNKKKDGELVVVRVTVSPIINDKKNVVGFLAIQRDVTKEEAADAALAKRADELERLNRVMIGRELRMVELKKKVTQLEGNLKNG